MPDAQVLLVPQLNGRGLIVAWTMCGERAVAPPAGVRLRFYRPVNYVFGGIRGDGISVVIPRKYLATFKE
jgi:hypothetical protein